MIFSKDIQEAINFAGIAHGEQKRKGLDIPYIVHPMSVAMILAGYGFEEKIIIAGILHDVVEDTSVTQAYLEEEFLWSISQYVKAVTEENKILAWEQRKKEAIQHVASMAKEPLAIKAADAIANMTDLIVGGKKDGDKFWAKFKRGKDSQLARYSALTRAIIKRKTVIGAVWHQKEPLIFDELESTLDTLLDCF